MQRIKIYLYKILVLVAVAVVGWRVYILGYSNVLSGSFSETKEIEVYKKAYALDNHNLGAIFKLAKNYHDKDDYERSNDYLFEALSVDPSYGRASGLLLNNFSKLGLTAEAKKAAYFSSKQWPAHSYVRAHLLDYWLLQGNKQKIFEELNVLLIRNPSLRKSIYPTLDLWAKDSTLRPLFSPYTASPPNWWNSYFSHMAYAKDSLSELDYFYSERLKSKTALSESEVRLMTQRLIKEKQWRKAHAVWVDGLPEKLKKYSKALFDGGFESGMKNEPFSWRFPKSKIFKASAGSTYGMKGRKALHLKFKRKKYINFRHISQRLILSSGKYTLGMRVRIDSNIGEKGLKWRLYCTGVKPSILGETESFITRKSWHSLIVSLEIPTENCDEQELRLEASSKYAHYQVFSGSLWFDDIEINKVEE